MRILISIFFCLLVSTPSISQANPLAELVSDLIQQHPKSSGFYVLEKGEEALLARGWLAQQATQSIAVQYFIWSSDNIGILAAEQLLSAAERGVKVRVLVDDLLIDAPDRFLLAMAYHPNIEIRIYRPLHSVGVSFSQRIRNLLTDFRAANQRMHDKSFIVDGLASIVGGRNMADEYFDYDHDYNFRDRDLLLVGPAVEEVGASFNRFWNSPFSAPIQSLLMAPLPEPERLQAYQDLHEYAQNPANFAPIVQKTLQSISTGLPQLQQKLHYGVPQILSDLPGKNAGRQGLAGSSRTSEALKKELMQAREKIVIQSPYLVLTETALELFQSLIQRGVEIEIVTNSLAATDNLMAFSGYQKQRQALLNSGIRIYEFRPDAKTLLALRDGHASQELGTTQFAIHAKTLIIDGRHLFIGTFNLDPRSVHLNTELVIQLDHPRMAQTVEQAIRQDMAPGNSWNPSQEKTDAHAPWGKRFKAWLLGFFPLEPLL